ncbi:MAG: hypothetical protein HY089_12970 [Ignavibacteriales bacterium]|nr:hypothetical protein [Ignavibacteriales bacterium]
MLWNQLEKANLIYSLSIDGRNPFPLFKQDGKPYTKALHTIWQFNLREIVVFPELSDFVKNNFLTFEELKAADEATDRKTSLQLTRRVAYISIGISVALAVITVIINYLTYTTERTVTIKNPSAFSDTTRVLILNQEKPLNQKPVLGKDLKK